MRTGCWCAGRKPCVPITRIGFALIDFGQTTAQRRRVRLRPSRHSVQHEGAPTQPPRDDGKARRLYSCIGDLTKTGSMRSSNLLRRPQGLLVIDDDPDVGEYIGQIARKAGYRVAVTNSFQEFRSAYADWVNVIVVDIMMPDVDGVEVLRYLGQKRSKAGLILVSAVDRRVINSVSHLARAQGLWVITGLQNPFTPGRLAEILDNLDTSWVEDDGIRSASPRQGHPEAITTARLREAIERDEILVLFQPKIKIENKKFLGVEALIRWQHPDLGILRPRQFVHVAEDRGYIDQITEVVTMRSLRRLSQWLRAGLDIFLSLNLSPR